MLDELAAEFRGWRIWRSQPNGLWWATRRGNIQYHDALRRPGWAITIGGVATLAELGDQLSVQRELDDPVPTPPPSQPTPAPSQPAAPPLLPA